MAALVAAINYPPNRLLEAAFAQAEPETGPSLPGGAGDEAIQWNILDRHAASRLAMTMLYFWCINVLPNRFRARAE